MSNLVQLGLKGSDIASAATVTLPRNGDRFDVTGTSAISAIQTNGRGPGARFYLRFTGAVTLTDGAYLSLRSGDDYATSPGDLLQFEVTAADQVRQVFLANGPGATAGNATSIQGIPVDPAVPIDGQVLAYQAGTSKYVPTTPEAAGTSLTLSDGSFEFSSPLRLTFVGGQLSQPEAGNVEYQPPALALSQGLAAPLTKPGYGVPVNPSLQIVQGLQSLWAFNEGSGDLVHDLFGSNDLTTVNGPGTWGSEASGPVLTLNGTDQKMQNAAPSLTFSSGLTFWVRCKITDRRLDAPAELIRTPFASGEVIQRWSSAGGFLFFINNGTTTLAQAFGSNAAYIDGWFNFFMRYDASTGRSAWDIDRTNLYDALNSAISLPSPAALGIFQSDDPSACVPGSLDMVAIWNRALEDEELAGLVEAPYLWWTPQSLTKVYPVANATYTQLGELWVFADTASADVTVTVPTAAGRQYPVRLFKTAAAHNLVIQAPAGQTINGSSSATLSSQWSSLTLYPAGGGFIAT